jgi:hypothetical protein
MTAPCVRMCSLMGVTLLRSKNLALHVPPGASALGRAQLAPKCAPAAKVALRPAVLGPLKAGHLAVHVARGSGGASSNSKQLR